MELIDPKKLDSRSRITLSLGQHEENPLRDEAIKAAESTIIHKPSATLQSSYVQVSMGDLKTA
ncbi:hypothetical protein PIB30_037421 [Stylosanthes scabra]|uniref:Uncharacterized protein n=1 Tax=Stylosanthes scabra TaxID=79078 RepID=A0ABU6ZAR1_9FABA|nr:hypothetical protein [Stylosanthes scabra]